MGNKIMASSQPTNQPPSQEDVIKHRRDNPKQYVLFYDPSPYLLDINKQRNKSPTPLIKVQTPRSEGENKPSSAFTAPAPPTPPPTSFHRISSMHHS